MIDRVFAALRPAFRLTHTRPAVVATVCVALAVLGGWGATSLQIDSDFSHLLPGSDPSVRALHELRSEIGGENEVAVLIESPSFAANRAFAEALIPKALDLRPSAAREPFLTHVAYRRDTRFLKRNALYFATPAELDTLSAFLDRKQREVRLEANPFYFDLDDEEASGGATETLGALDDLYDQLVASEYPVSRDSTLLVVRLYPSGAQTDLDYIDSTYQALDGLIADLSPASYHPEMTVELGGRLERQLVEVRAITRDVAGSFGAGVLTLLVLAMAYFVYKNVRARAGTARFRQALLAEAARSPVTALVLGLPLLVSLAWTFGIVSVVYGRLNLMTSTLGLVLFGLGIDFGIHFLARYTEERGGGASVPAALDTTFQTTGRAIAAVAITTAGGFFVLLAADFKGFSQFGFTAGLGTLAALGAMLTLLPALLALFEQTPLIRRSSRPVDWADAARDASSNGRGGLGFRATRARWIVGGILLASGVAVAAAVLELDEVRFQYDFGELEPRYEEYEARKRKARAVYTTRGSRNPAYLLTDSRTDAEAVARVLRRRMHRDTTSPTIDRVETIYDRFPVTDSARAAKLTQIATIREQLEDRFLRASDDPTLQKLRLAASTTEPVAIDQVPDFVKNPFLTKDGTIAEVVLVYPSVGLSDGWNSMAFADDVGRVTLANGRTYHAASTSIVASRMLRLMIREAPLMVGLTIGIVILFKVLVLRRVRWVLIALLPLTASFLWMFGVMGATGLMLTFYNLVVLPTVLGIGDDSGIHIVHRYLEEGRGRIGRVLRSTGEHVAVSSVTTMVGFGGLVLSMHPGLRSIGLMAVLGIAMTLIAALVTLPAVLAFLELRSEPGSSHSGSSADAGAAPDAGVPTRENGHGPSRSPWTERGQP